MRIKDIKVGETYAYGTSDYEREPSRYNGQRNAKKVTVLEAGIKRRVWTGYRFEESARADGVRVRKATWNGEEEEVLTAAGFIEPWAEYEAAEEEAARRHQERNGAKLAHHKDLVDRLGDLRSQMPADARFPYWADGTVYADGSYSDGGKILLSDLVSLLEQAYAAGQAAGR